MQGKDRVRPIVQHAPEAILAFAPQHRKAVAHFPRPLNGVLRVKEAPSQPACESETT
jgi:hypothetical protein